MSDLNSEIQTMLDEHKVTKRIIEFAKCLDEKNFVGYANLYAEDGELKHPWGGHKGRAGLAEYVEHDLGKYVATQHMSGSQFVEINGNTAKARAGLMAIHTSNQEGTNFWVVGGHYIFDLEKIDGNWYFKHFEIKPAWQFKSNPETPEI